MFKQHSTFFRRSMIACDMLIAAASFYVAYYIRTVIGPIAPLANYVWILPVVIFSWLIMLYYSNMYRSFRLKSKRTIFWIIWRSAVLGIVFFGALQYLLNIEHVSRLMMLLVYFLSALMMTVEKMILILLLNHLRQRGLNYRQVLVVGTGSQSRKFLRVISMHREFGLKVIGLIDRHRVMLGQMVEGYEVIGNYKDVDHLLVNEIVDRVVILVEPSQIKFCENIMKSCERVGIPFNVGLDVFRPAYAKHRVEQFFGLSMISYQTTNDRLSMLIIKRIFDLIVSSLAIFILSPLMITTMVLIKKTSEGPIFYRQKRCGLNGRMFTLYKFRTMVANAEAQQKDLLKLNEMEGPVFKITNDPRVTPIGKFLRKFSIDELPQLWNVLKGDMSLVGPRPPIDLEVKQYDSTQRRRLSVRPGITCIWQVSGRNNITNFDRWISQDLQYIDNWSLWLDIKILFKTLPAVIFGAGAK